MWSEGGIGNRNVIWFEDVREVINKYVLLLLNENFVFELIEVVKIIMKKRNWSVFGLDRIVNYWWKKVYVLYEGVIKLF